LLEADISFKDETPEGLSEGCLELWDCLLPPVLLESLNRASRTVAHLIEQLEAKYPRLRDHRDSMRVAVNETFARPGARLSEGDTIALIPPVSGG